MKAAFVKDASEGGGVELRDVERPPLTPGSIIVKLKASGVCGTDLEKLTGRNITTAILGHEVSGIITESDSDTYPVGSRVVPHHHVACGECILCKAGAGTMCTRFKASNFVPCGFSEEFLVPSYNVENGGVHFIQDNLSYEEASIAEPLACCIRGLNRVVKGKWLEPDGYTPSILVVGAGPIGILHMELLKSRNLSTKMVAADISMTRLEFARKFEGAETVEVGGSTGGLFANDAISRTAEGRGFDLVIVATGAQSAFAEAAKCVAKSGTLLLFGAPHKGATFSLDLAKLFLDEVTITTSYSAVDTEISEALGMLESGDIDARNLITAKYPLAQIAEAMGAAHNENQVKVIVAD